MREVGFQIILNLSIAVHALATPMKTSLSVDEILLAWYVYNRMLTWLLLHENT